MKNGVLFTSQIGQDRWVIKTLKEKRDGVFVDVGAGPPVEINNTHALEKEYGWTGVSMDIGPPHTHHCQSMSSEEYKSFWNHYRDTPIVCGDALQVDFEKVFEECGLPKNIDYLSMDLDPPMATYQALLRIPFSKYTFNVITFETDFYREESTREPSREFLQKLGYVLDKPDQPDYGDPQEDWYIHTSLKAKRGYDNATN